VWQFATSQITSTGLVIFGEVAGPSTDVVSVMLGVLSLGTLVQPIMKRLWIALAVIVVATPTLACINTFGTDLKGEVVETFLTADDLVEYLTMPGGPNWRAQKKKLSRNLAQASLEQRNDYAAALIHLGEIQPALAILVRIEQSRPGLYTTATNLGTAYELIGKNEHALSWIRAGIRRNPESHDGSEWLHVAILESKLAMAGNPGWLRTHSVLGLDFGSEAAPRMPAGFPSGNDGKTLDARETWKAIHVQMAERLQFVGPPDPIVGDLLFDYANLLMLTDTMENAAAIYELALRYDTPRAALAKQRLEHARLIVKRASK
jgi:tetratricopeptide (TPR) repeat protein